MVVSKLRQYPERLFLAGGMIRSCIVGEKVNDVDLFASSPELAKQLATEVAAEIGCKIHSTQYAYTIRPPHGLCIQFIHRWTFTTPEQCIESFDFTIAKAAIFYGVKIPGIFTSDEENQKVHSICHDDYYADLAARRLVYVNPERNEEPGGSLLRVLKFYQKGYRIPLSSLADVIVRLNRGVDWGKVRDEGRQSEVILGLLFEVDPNNSENEAYIRERNRQITSRPAEDNLL